jgi:hypothetical protein
LLNSRKWWIFYPKYFAERDFRIPWRCWQLTAWQSSFENRECWDKERIRMSNWFGLSFFFPYIFRVEVHLQEFRRCDLVVKQLILNFLSNKIQMSLFFKTFLLFLKKICDVIWSEIMWLVAKSVVNLYFLFFYFLL